VGHAVLLTNKLPKRSRRLTRQEFTKPGRRHLHVDPLIPREQLQPPGRSNSAIIGALNDHDDDLVAQYSIWAITENPKLGLADLRVNLKDIESLPPNVRGWLYRLIAADAVTAEGNLEYIVVGSEDRETEAREGLAIAIRNTYFDGLDETVFDWFPDEPVPAIKDRLLEHMAANADRCGNYERPVIDYYRDAGGLLRSRLEVASQRTSMYGKLRRIAISSEQASLDLTTQQTVQVTMVQQNINTGGGSIGVVSGEGTVIAHSIQAVNSMAGNNDLKDALSDLLAFIEKSSLAASQKKEGAELVTAVAAQPTRTGLGKLAGWLKVLIEASVLGVEASHVLPAILQRLQECMVLLPG
jgi:hypothetical protein